MQTRIGFVITAFVTILMMAAIACGDANPLPVVVDPTSEPPSSTPATDDPDETGMVQVAAPIDGVKINIAESFPPQYFVHVQSGLPNACHKFDKHEVSRAGEVINITVTNLKPLEPLMCAEIYGTVESTIALGTDFEGGKTYTVRVNDVTVTFVAQ